MYIIFHNFHNFIVLWQIEQDTILNRQKERFKDRFKSNCFYHSHAIHITFPDQANV